MSVVGRLASRVLDILATRFLEERQIHVGGDVYMRRFYLCGVLPDRTAALFPPDQRPRERLAWVGRTVYLHCIRRPDRDRWLHNHPWSGTSVILAGGYVEQRYVVHPAVHDGIAWREHRPLSVVRLRPNTYHRIDRLLARESWSLFVAGERVQKWGYWDPEGRRHVPWREVHQDPGSDEGDG